MGSLEFIEVQPAKLNLFVWKCETALKFEFGVLRRAIVRAGYIPGGLLI